MNKPVLVVTTHHAKEVEERIDQNYDARRNPNEAPFSRLDLLTASDGADALFITPVDRLDSEFFKSVWPSVKVIATYSVGFEHIDLAAAARRKIAIAYIPGINSEATADIAILLLVGASRRAYEAQEIIRTGAWRPTTSSNGLLGWQRGTRRACGLSSS
jgi:lactate dehydrogenase-like 2-hydroxyacid dehydrogenase